MKTEVSELSAKDILTSRRLNTSYENIKRRLWCKKNLSFFLLYGRGISAVCNSVSLEMKVCCEAQPIDRLKSLVKSMERREAEVIEIRALQECRVGRLFN